MPNYPTAHIKATPDDFAKTVLMPGDPLRSKFIAENYLENARLVNNVRGVQGYTGEYKGIKVSVMASGMGIPSMGIYSYELFNFFNVENIIRIGSAGALQENIKVRDIVIGMGACTNSNYATQYRLMGNYAPICSFELLKTVSRLAEKSGVNYHIGNLLSSDTFYADETMIPEQMSTNMLWKSMGVMAVEMEAAALYMNAAKCGKNAIAICTVSNHIITGEDTTSEERRSTFTKMIEIALETAVEKE